MGNLDLDNYVKLIEISGYSGSIVCDHAVVWFTCLYCKQHDPRSDCSLAVGRWDFRFYEGSDVVSVDSPPGFKCWISFTVVFSCIYTVESIYLFYLLLYLKLYLLDDTLISKGSFMGTNIYLY